MLWEKSKEEYIYIYIYIYKRGQQLKEKINRKTTMNLGLPSSDFKKRREKRGGEEKKSYRHQTIMNCTTCITATQVLHVSNDIVVRSFWLQEDFERIARKARAMSTCLCALCSCQLIFYLLED
jgi:hypothetical protein